MLDVNHETRPSIESFGLRFGELLSLITKPDSERQPVRTSDFLQPQYLIGTDLPPKDEHALRWEEVFPLGDMEQHTGELNRAEQVVYARERLLGEQDIKYSLDLKFIMRGRAISLATKRSPSIYLGGCGGQSVK